MTVGGGGPHLPWPVVGAVVLASLAGSGFFSGTETGLMSASRIRLHLRARRRADPRLAKKQLEQVASTNAALALLLERITT